MDNKYKIKFGYTESPYRNGIPCICIKITFTKYFKIVKLFENIYLFIYLFAVQRKKRLKNYCSAANMEQHTIPYSC